MTDCSFNTILPPHLLVTFTYLLHHPPLHRGRFLPLTAEFLCVLHVWRIHSDNIQHHCLTPCSPPQHYPCSIAPPTYSMEQQPESTASAPALLSCAHHRSIDPPSYLCSLPLPVIGPTVGVLLSAPPSCHSFALAAS